MVLLALIVTRSSVVALQAREGLPLGNQVVGWFVLGRLFTPLSRSQALADYLC